MGRLGKVDPSSYSQPELITTEHSDIKWQVDFASTKLRGSVLHKFKVLSSDLEKIVSSELILPLTSFKESFILAP